CLSRSRRVRRSVLGMKKRSIEGQRSFGGQERQAEEVVRIYALARTVKEAWQMATLFMKTRISSPMYTRIRNKVTLRRHQSRVQPPETILRRLAHEVLVVLPATRALGCTLSKVNL